MALDPKTHKIYMANAKFETAPEPQAGQKRQRPRIVPDTFKILVYAKEQ